LLPCSLLPPSLRVFSADSVPDNARQEPNCTAARLKPPGESSSPDDSVQHGNARHIRSVLAAGSGRRERSPKRITLANTHAPIALARADARPGSELVAAQRNTGPDICIRKHSDFQGEGGACGPEGRTGRPFARRARIVVIARRLLVVADAHKSSQAASQRALRPRRSPSHRRFANGAMSVSLMKPSLSRRRPLHDRFGSWCHERRASTTARNCTRDKGRSFEAGSQVLASNRGVASLCPQSR
jgi:hypothetical protein